MGGVDSGVVGGEGWVTNEEQASEGTASRAGRGARSGAERECAVGGCFLFEKLVGLTRSVMGLVVFVDEFV